MHDEPSLEAWRSAAAALNVPAQIAQLPLEAALGMPLAEPVTAPHPLPHVPCSAMDGYAVAAGTDPTATLPVVADIPAGVGLPAPLPEGTAARIMTGAPLPAGAGIVVPVELTDADPFGPLPQTVTLAAQETDMRDGRHIRAVGEELAQGAVIAAAGERVGPGLVGLARAAGIDTCTVRKPVRVGIIATGDELVDESCADGSVRESNTGMLAAAVTALGHSAETVRSGDDPDDFFSCLSALAARSDLVLTTGGVGVGAFDVVKLALTEQGCSRFAHLALRPGGPQGMGELLGADGRRVPLLHFPGTPVGALLAFHLFAREALGQPALRCVMPLASGEEILRKPGVFARPVRIGADGAHVMGGKRLAPFATAHGVALLGYGQSAGMKQIPAAHMVDILLF
ncbi:molybdopterin molybdotransferase MoeA [Dermabacteraceae bacterium P9123]